MKKKNIKLFLITLLIITSCLSATYAYLKIETTASTNTTNTGCFKVNYTGQIISGATLKSGTSYLEGTSSDVVLSKDPDCPIYTQATILLHTNPVPLDKRAPIENGSLKFNVINNTTKASVGSGTIQSQGDEDQELATVPLSTTAVTYKVYIWVDSNISLGTFNGKEYSGYLYANSVQSSDITIK